MDEAIMLEARFRASPPKCLGVLWTAALALSRRTGEPPAVFCLFVLPRITHLDEDALPLVPVDLVEARVKFFELLDNAPTFSTDAAQPTYLERAAGFVNVSEIPGGACRLFITCKRDDWHRVEKTWQLIESEVSPWLSASPDRQTSSSTPTTDPIRPWEKIPDAYWDRQAVRLWWEGFTTREIASRLGKDSKTISNRLSVLRRSHGDNVIPKRKRSSQ